ncbi:MAG: glycosyltransferase family 2 protein [Bacteroidales bacterium]|nr:glycosyltransferase family 2 protein [Bacteroidales bacterium]
MSDSPVRTVAVIPTHNNAGTVEDVVRRTLAQIKDVIVVNDGCTDGTAEILASLPVTVVTAPKNEGKGCALKRGFAKALELGFTHAVTLDADGQHFPEDIPLLLEKSSGNPDALIIGSRDLNAENMPGGNTFANKFSNFWFTVDTWRRIPDTQTGFRIYPLKLIPRIVTARFEAELALLVFSAWRGLKTIPVAVRVFYPEHRVSSFDPTVDFARISIMNVCLLILAFVYGYPRMLIQRLFK